MTIKLAFRVPFLTTNQAPVTRPFTATLLAQTELFLPSITLPKINTLRQPFGFEKYNIFNSQESKAFLTETVLNKFNHTERLGLVFYSKKAEKAVGFNDLADDTDKNINYAKNLIQSQTQALHGRPSLMKLFQELLVNYQPNNDNSEVRQNDILLVSKCFILRSATLSLFRSWSKKQLMP